MIIFGTRAKLLPQHTHNLSLHCSHCGAGDATNIYKQFRYFHVFWIPFFPYGSKLITECGHCKKVSYERELDPRTLADIKSQGVRKIPFGYYAGILLIGLFFGAATIEGISGSIKTSGYLENPQIGDVYEVKRKEDRKSVYTLYRVAEVTPDSVTFDMNDYEAVGISNFRKLRKQHGNSYSEKTTLARTTLQEMKKKNLIADIKRK